MSIDFETRAKRLHFEHPAMEKGPLWGKFGIPSTLILFDLITHSQGQ